MARPCFNTIGPWHVFSRGPDLQEAATESFDKLVSPKYNGEASLSKSTINIDTLCKALLTKISFRRGDRVVYGAALEICRHVWGLLILRSK